MLKDFIERCWSSNPKDRPTFRAEVFEIFTNLRGEMVQEPAELRLCREMVQQAAEPRLYRGGNPNSEEVSDEYRDSIPHEYDDPRVIVGLNFGTIFSGFAYALTSAPDKIYGMYEWPMWEHGGREPYCKTLTAVYYERGRDGKLAFHSWGWPARAAYLSAMRAFHRANKRAGAGTASHSFPAVGEVLTKFKLHLASLSDGPQWLNNLPGKPKLDQVISDFLRGIGEHLMTHLQRCYGNQFTKEVVQWCLTVPSSWDDHAKQQMKPCMKKAGLVKSAKHPQASPYRVIVILEPEAAAMHCLPIFECYLHLQLGGKLLMVDLDGGTMHILVQARANHTGALKVKEVSRPSRELCGTTSVNNSFMTFLQCRIGCLEEFLEQHPEVEAQILGWWESAMLTFDGSPDFKDSLQINDKLARAWEDPIVDQNLGLIEEKLWEHPDIKLIIVVGNFSLSPFMMARIKETFASRVAAIIHPPNPASALSQWVVAQAVALHSRHQSVPSRASAPC